MPARANTPKAAAVRICWEMYGLNVGRIRLWHEADAIEKRLGIRAKVARAAYRFAANSRWIAVVGDPVFFVMLLEEGRTMLEEEEKN
jgi:hypothetical protein